MAKQSAADQLEGTLTFARIRALQRDPVQGIFDAAHLKEIHRRIFQDIPHHAPGEYRPAASVHIKDRALENIDYGYFVPYAHRSQVDAGVEKVLSDLQAGDSLRGLNRDQFATRMAQLYGDLDFLHPFKEGNSRTLRSFTAQLAGKAGRELDWHTSNVDAISRDRLYIARDREVLLRMYPGLDETRAMTTDSRSEYEAYLYFVEPFKDADSLHTVIRESTFDMRDINAAKLFNHDSREEAIKKYPDLAGSFEQMASIARMAQLAGLNAKQESLVMKHAREILTTKIKRGERPIFSNKERQNLERGSRSDPLERER